MIGGSGLELGQQAGAELGGEEGSILAPEGSSVAEDGSILAADGTVLAPPGTVMIGEDGTLMMAEGSSLLQEPERKEGEVGGIMAGEGNVLLDTEGNVLTDQDGNILTTADIGKLGGAELVGEGDAKGDQQEGGSQFVGQQGVAADQLLAGTNAGNQILTTADGNQIIAGSDGNVITSDGNFLRTQDGQILTDGEGNFLTADGNVLKPEDAQKLLDETNNAEVDGGVGVKEGENNSEKTENMSTESEPVTTPSGEENVSQSKSTEGNTNSSNLIKSTEQEATDQMKLAVEAAMEEGSDIIPAPTGEPSKNEADNAQEPAINAENETEKSVTSNLEAPEPSKIPVTEAEAVTNGTGGEAVLISNSDTDVMPSSLPSGILPEGQGTDILKEATSTSGVVIPASGDGGIYTSADGTVLSVPEGLMTNAEGNLINPADGSILTTEDGTPLVLPQGAVLQTLPSSLPPGFTSVTSIASITLPNSSNATQGGIMVNATESAIMTTSETSLASGQQPALAPSSGTMLAAGSVLASEDGTMMTAPEGSIVASDGSILAADGSVLAPPGSVVTTDQQLAPVTQQQPPQNLIGLQLPEESGEVLYLDPNDPAAQLLLREAGITLGEGGVLQTADGQVLHSEDGNPITTNSKQPPTNTRPTNNLMADAAAAAGLSEDLGFQLPTGVKADTSAIDIPLSQQTSNLQPNLPLSQSYSQAVTEEPTQRHIFQPRVGAQQSQQQQSLGAVVGSSNNLQQKFQKLTFNSNANYASPAATAPLQKKAVTPR